jgi:hypothetical protein
MVTLQDVLRTPGGSVVWERHLRCQGTIGPRSRRGSGVFYRGGRRLATRGAVLVRPRRTSIAPRLHPITLRQARPQSSPHCHAASHDRSEPPIPSSIIRCRSEAGTQPNSARARLQSKWAFWVRDSQSLKLGMRIRSGWRTANLTSHLLRSVI